MISDEKYKKKIKLHHKYQQKKSDDPLYDNYMALLRCIELDANPNQELGLNTRIFFKEENLKSIKREYEKRDVIRVYFPSGRTDEGTISELLERNAKYKWTRHGINRVLRGDAERHKKFRFERVG